MSKDTSLVDDRNNALIKKYVLNNFGLTQESNSRFVNLLDNPDIDETYLPWLGEDLRARFPIDKEKLKNYDTSWEFFRSYFPTYVEEYHISYKNYVQGKLIINKNELRLFKHLKMYYFDSYRGRTSLCNDIKIYNDFHLSTLNDYFEERVNQIISNRLPSKAKFEVVLSLNFADWFLCSTGEQWTTCLNLESTYFACYWAGLPGFAADRNKALLYITTGEKKEYLGIITDKMLGRTFLTLNQNNNIRTLKWYPNEIFYKNGVMNNLPFSVQAIDEYTDVVKHKINLLFFNNGWSCFAYQDKTIFKYFSQMDVKNIVFETVSKGGEFYINESDGNFEDGPIFSWKNGFKALVKDEKCISDQTGLKCSICHKSIFEEDELYDEDSNYYCESCYNNLFKYCDCCGKYHPREEVKIVQRSYYCPTCYDKYFVVCKKCNMTVERQEIVNARDTICYTCTQMN